jgi:hypothetical protein
MGGTYNVFTLHLGKQRDNSNKIMIIKNPCTRTVYSIISRLSLGERSERRNNIGLKLLEMQPSRVGDIVRQIACRLSFIKSATTIRLRYDVRQCVPTS